MIGMAVRECGLEEFVKELSSGSPIPGGGGASALAGVLGSALGQMVANLTVGKKKYASVESEILECQKKMEQLLEEFFQLADQDEEVFKPLAAAYRLPSQTEEERAYKEQVMEQCSYEASLVPLQVMKCASDMLDIMEVLAEKGSRMAVSDVGVGVQFIRTALSGAAMNVFINTASMKDRGRAVSLNQKAQNMLECGMVQADVVYDKVKETFGNEKDGIISQNKK